MCNLATYALETALPIFSSIWLFCPYHNARLQDCKTRSVQHLVIYKLPPQQPQRLHLTFNADKCRKWV
ncbi:hypothetical protein NA56DRAFT_143885 [Hyaloscypha hepaticicola]|uniref:Uncharacterized protein n=1 Tax=Hyaloscypha hepaticicola TaxID=2082293 RepID=A0A2J6QN49_9HELO|nr:hypothetical protein NA56DRAFT_143885 [Hyaloscypha hepaticicola]